MEDLELRAEPKATYDAMQAVLFRILDRITASDKAAAPL